MEKEIIINASYDIKEDFYTICYSDYQVGHEKIEFRFENSEINFDFYIFDDQINKIIIYNSTEFIQLLEDYHKGKQYEFECDYDCYWFYGKNHQTLEYQGTTTSSDLLFILDLSKSNQAIRLEIIFGSFLKKILKQTQQKIQQKFCNDDLIFVDIS